MVSVHMLVDGLEKSYTLPHPIWQRETLEDVKVHHHEPQCFRDRLAHWTIQIMRRNFDWMTGFKWWKTESIWLTRMIFLETVAAVPGSIAGTIRHLASLRRMKRDHGWIHTMLEEAENERMHLLTFLQLKKPGPFMRLMVFLAQGAFFNFYWVAYLVSPKFCHRLVGYLEEEAVITYSKCIEHIDQGKIWKDKKAPEIGISYWKLQPNATMRDLILVIRADEAHHRDVNHEFASLSPEAANPFPPGY